MNTGLGPSEATRHIRVYFDNDLLGSLAYSAEMRCIGTEVEEAVLVHRCNLKKCDIVLNLQITVVSWELRVADWHIIRAASGYQLALKSAHMPGVPGKMFSGILTLEYC